jgi:dipeptidyl aminopeptidase/acylaminoacyl peptidase
MSSYGKKRHLIWSFAAMFFVCAILSAILEIRARASNEERSSQRIGRYFTVKDSIEMARFGGLGEEPTFSPDGKYLAVVSSRGIIESNQIESTLMVLETEAVKESLRRKETKELTPKVVAKLAATPTIEAYGSNKPIISNVEWTQDSKRLLFLVQNSRAKRQLFEACVSTATATAVTPEDQDVSQFDSAGSTIVYRVTQFEGNDVRGDPINAAARDVTGMELNSILFSNDSTPSGFSTLWVSRHSGNAPVIDPTAGHPFRLWDSPPVIWSALSISPDGKSVVTLIPVNEIPPSWEHYEPKYSRTAKIHAGDSRLTSDLNQGRLTQYALIDLTTGKARPLVDAPNGWALGYGDRNRAAWSSDGKKVLLVNTFLPLEDVDESEKSRRVRACAAAVVDISSMTSRCVSFGHVAHVWGSSFGLTSDDVILRFDEQTPSDSFHFQQGRWQLEVPSEKGAALPTHCVGPRPNLYGGLSVDVHQDLNDPPTLWARECATRLQKAIWDPNPQLANMRLGEASIIHWKDTSGYEWKGLLVKPPDYVSGKRYPLVIEPYGFQEHEFVTDGQHTTAHATRPLADAGMIVLAFWFRFDHVVTEDEASDQILGYESAIETLTSEGLVDPNKIGIIGFSRTCYHVESALIKHPTRFAAATIADGVDESYVQSLLFPVVYKEAEKIYGAKPFGEGLRTWVDRAPGFHLDRIQTPLRIEAIGPASVLWEWELYTSLWAQKKPVDLIYIPGGQHTLQKPLDRMASQQGNVDWFRFWLKDEEDSDPAKVGQYARWRQLRAQRSTEEHTSKP